MKQEPQLSPIDREKEGQRKEMRRILRNMDARWVQAASRDVAARVGEIISAWKDGKAGRVLAYVPFFEGEVDLAGFLTQQAAHRTLYLPRRGPDFSMVFLSVGEFWQEDLRKEGVSIPEPESESGVRFNPADPGLTVVILPGLLFSRDGERLGRGRGYYDRFLAQPGLEDALKIGVCWDLQLVEKLPRGRHDINVDWICTEREVVQCR